MLLAINVDNTRISVGIFNTEGNIVSKFKIATDIKKTFDEYSSLMRMVLADNGVSVAQIKSAIIASVVPQLTDTVRLVAARLSGSDPIIVGPGVKTGFLIKIDSPSELGGDMVANTAAVIYENKVKGKCNVPSIVVDMNTVTTVSAINGSNEYVGCSIIPGIQMSFEAMHETTALLPNVDFTFAKNAIGKNSHDSVCSGVICGNAIMLDGFVYRFAREMKCKPDDIDLTITGEYAKYVVGLCGRKYSYDENLTLKGLYVIYQNNINR